MGFKVGMYKPEEGNVQLRDQERTAGGVVISCADIYCNKHQTGCLTQTFSLPSQKLTLLAPLSCVSFMAPIECTDCL